MTRARDLSNDEANGGGATPPFVAGKNFAINGGFDIFQRTSFASQTGSGWAFDRWYAGVGGTVTLTQQTTGVPVGSQYCGRIAYNASSSFANIFQPFESANVAMLLGKTVTLTAKVRRNSAFAGGLQIGVAKNSTANTNTGGTWSTVASVTVGNASLPTGTTSNDWYTATFSAVIPNDGTAAGLRIQIGETVAGASGEYWEVAQVQLEIGSVATPFSRAGGSSGAELALCQRYYFRTTGGSGYQPVCFGFASSTTNVMGYVQYPVTMRTTPTAIEYATLQCNDSTTGTAVSAVAFSGTEVGPSSATLNFTCSSMTTFRPVKVLQSNSASGYLALSAEL